MAERTAMDCSAKLRFLRELITLKSDVLQTVLFSRVACVRSAGQFVNVSFLLLL